MRFTFKRSFIGQDEAGEEKLMSRQETLESLNFDQVMNFEGSPSETKKEIDRYHALVAKKAVQPVFDRYHEALTKETTETFTETRKANAIADMEASFPYLTDVSLIPEKKDPRLVKKLQRVKIKTGVRDTDDSVADLAKWNSLLTSMIFSMFDAMTETQKAKIPADQRGTIDIAREIFKSTPTALDVRLPIEGKNLIQRVMKREEIIGRIIKGDE